MGLQSAGGVDLDVVMVTWNSARTVSQCVHSVMREAEALGIRTRIWAVDNGSTDGTVQLLRTFANGWPLGFCVLELRRNHGTTVSRNLALRRTTAPSVLVLDSDAELLPGSLGRLLLTANGCPKAGLVGPRLYLGDGTIQRSFKRFPTVLSKLGQAMQHPLLARLKQAEFYSAECYTSQGLDGPVLVDSCISAAWLVRREAMEAVGLLDERIFYSPEDVDYCLRLWLKGWQVIYEPRAGCVHHTQRLSHRSIRFAIHHMLGLTYYFAKHRYWLRAASLYRRIGIQPGAAPAHEWQEPSLHGRCIRER